MYVPFRDNVLFRNANLRRLVFGRLVTNAGDSVYAIAAMWLVYDLTGSSAYTGLAGLLTMGPQALQVFIGPLVDHWPLRRILVSTQAVQAVLVLVIPLASYLDALSVWVVLTVMPLVSFLNQFVYPAQNAALPRIVDQEDLVSANSLLSLAYQGVDMAFNALAGVLVAAVGAVTLYLLDSVSFAVAAALFIGLRVPKTSESAGGEAEKDAEPGDDPTTTAAAVVTDGGDDADGSATADVDEDSSYLADLRAGLSFVRGTILLPLLVTSVVANGTLGGVWATMPAFADARGGPEAYGVLMAAVAGGLLVGALVASWFEEWPLGRLTVALYAFSGSLWLAAVASSSLVGTAGLLALALVPVGISNVIVVTMFQTMVPDDLLGRVMATIGSISTVAMPLGSAAGGLLADATSASYVVAGGGLGLLFVAVYVVAIPSLRRLPRADELETLRRTPTE
ncbi:Transmembrane secretion effector [Halogranum amylolyticum]|uniref:Transmembrane secretion effector n=1 Tax=Halogranum amylolyticum TaxID=660520 RepID=A0A1H8QUE7_9EURY|nr:MFS transporter [Halogranum amylolyticum]SEO57548.1 Transmembrane secretion effector [Halogranum amylolyticum]